MLDFRIETFLVLCRTLNFTRAAEILRITQPTATQHIKYLEALYGCKLFSYQGKTLSLTEQGERLKGFAVSMTYNSQSIQTRMRQGVRPPPLRIGATKTIGEFVIGPEISTYLKQNPQRRLSLLVDNTHTLLGLLERGELDFAVLEGFFNKSKYGYRLYKNAPFVGVCAADHPLADRDLTISDIMDQNIILREPGSGTRAIFEQLLETHNYDVSALAQTTVISDFSVTKQLVSDGVGITFLYYPVVERELTEGSLKMLRLCQMQVYREFNFVFLKETLFRNEWQGIFSV